MKKLIILALALTLALPSFAFADEKIPSEFWQLIKVEADLAETDDLQGQIDNWLEIISLFDSWPDTSQKKLEIVTPRYQKIINNYEALKNYDLALVYLEIYLKHATQLETMGLWDQFARLWAESKIINLNLDVDLFVTAPLDDVEEDLAKYEPQKGLYYGAPYDLDPNVDRLTDVGHVAAYPKTNSAFLIYLEFETDIQDFDWYISQAKEAGAGIMLAWNAYEVYEDMSVHKAYIEETASYIKNLEVPVFLRYGAEFNIAEGFEDHEGFKDNYRYLTDLVRSKADNVATVWSPNDISESSRDHEDYYPGDEYVDWVGMSTYTYYYFGSQKDYGDQQEAIDNQFFTGPKANPLSKVQDIIETYGHKKPIMLSENGIGHYSKVAKEDLTDWAIQQLRRTYAYIPLKYPQVKAIFYFNAHVPSNTNNIYALYENEKFREAFVDLTSSQVYLDKMSTELTTYPQSLNKGSYEISEDSIDLQTLVIVPDVLEPTVRYYINDQETFSSKVLPYHYSLDRDDLNDGLNTLTLEVIDDQGDLVKTLTYNILKSKDSIRISKPKQLTFQLDNPTVRVNSETSQLDAAPFLKAGTSMVPLRFIGEALGAKVTWYAETRSVSYEKGDQAMVLSLDDTTAYMNGQAVSLSVAPTLMGGRTFVPVRVISEYFGATVNWRAADRSIIIDIY